MTVDRRAGSRRSRTHNEPGVTLGAVAHQGRVDALVRITQDAVSKGASLRCGGNQVARDGFYFAPTILADVLADADVMGEEPLRLAPSLPDVPLGGLGNSGYGYEGSVEGILSFCQLRLVSETS